MPCQSPARPASPCVHVARVTQRVRTSLLLGEPSRGTSQGRKFRGGGILRDLLAPRGASGTPDDGESASRRPNKIGGGAGDSAIKLVSKNARIRSNKSTRFPGVLCVHKYLSVRCRFGERRPPADHPYVPCLLKQAGGCVCVGTGPSPGRASPRCGLAPGRPVGEVGQAPSDSRREGCRSGWRRSAAPCRPTARSGTCRWPPCQECDHRLVLPGARLQGAASDSCEDLEARRGDRGWPPGQEGDHRPVRPGAWLQGAASDPAAKTAKLAAEIADGRLANRAINGLFFQELVFEVLPRTRLRRLRSSPRRLLMAAWP
jgi:hypothetical protein